MENAIIRKALIDKGYHMKDLASALGITRESLSRKLGRALADDETARIMWVIDNKMPLKKEGE